jgi:hypothetical protein
MRDFRALLAIALTASGLFFCTTLNMAGGSSSTDNGRIIGMVCRENGLPASEVCVALRPAGFDPGQDTSAPRLDTTDEAGDYDFKKLAPGVYTLEAVAIDDRTRALVNPVMVDTSITYAPIAALAKPGALRVLLQNGPSASEHYVFIPGTSHSGFVRNGVGFIDSVPAGIVPALCYVDIAEPAAIHTLKTGFSLGAGATRVIADYSSWNHSERLFLNTTMSGADVSGTVVDFPVIVRLSVADFDFSQAKIDGSDLRFKKLDDTPLAYEIERWDAAGQQAEVWVRVDTVHGNDSTQFFTMCWGNPAAPSESNSAAVFDTAAGFEGVWHLNGSGNGTAFDATANHYDGTPYNMTTASSVPGAIGNARGFNGTTQYIAMANTAASRLNFPQNGGYSMSAWVYTDTIDTIWRAIAGKGREQYYMQEKNLGKGRATWEFVEFQDQKGWEYTEDSVPPAPGARQWLNIVGVRSGAVQRLYINGKLVIDSIALMPGNYSRVTTDNFLIGRFARLITIPYSQGLSYFKGTIDEVRVCATVPSADRIKLCYMNQKADGTLIVFRK